MSQTFRYLALDVSGRRVSGLLRVADLDAAQSQLVGDGLAAIRIRAVKASAADTQKAGKLKLSRRLLAELLRDLGTLAEAGVKLRQALSILAHEESAHLIRRAARQLEIEISAGRSLEAAFSKSFGRGSETVSALVASGEASGDLAGALLRAAETLEQELELSEALVSALSYPAFLILMFVTAFLVLLVFVVPALGPLVQQSGAEAPAFMSALLKLSGFLIEHGLEITLCIFALVVAVAGAWRFNLLRASLESWLLDGPLKRIVRGLVFGGVASVFGGLVASRVPAPEALQLSLRSANMGLARKRLVQSAILIRDGVAVSQALRRCRGMPVSIIRLASIGEEVGRLGPLVQRAGRLEQARNLRALKAISQWLGPAMIVLLGGVIGLVMAGLLTSITTMGSEITR